MSNAAPQGLDIPAQGKAQRRQPHSAALGCVARGVFALQGQDIRERSDSVDPGVMLGKPVIRGTRITVDLVVRKFSEGATETDVLDAYPLAQLSDLFRF